MCVASWRAALGPHVAPGAKKHSDAATLASNNPEPLNAIAATTWKRIDSSLLASKAERHHPRDDRRDREAAARQRLLEEEHRREGPAAVSRDAAV